MPSCRSSSNQNTRVFAPHVIFQQDTTRLAITLTSGQGYTLEGITAGDVIRYDPINGSYKKSLANTEINAEVLGVVESGITAPYTVVIYGSIKYPQSRLNQIVSGADGGIDVLFLDDQVSGGLTGSIDLTTGVKIVKPVMQVAPHGVYNGVVTNYIGYKTGSAPSSGPGFAPPDGGIIMGPKGLDNEYWLDLSLDQTISASDYPTVYQTYGTDYGPYQELVTVSSGTVTSGLIGKQAYQLINNIKNYVGVVTAVDIIGTITVEKASGTQLYDTSKTLYVDKTPFGISSTSVSSFFVPKVNINAEQNGETLTAYLKLFDDPRTVTIPNELSVNQLTAESTLTVNGVDVGAKLAELEVKINLLNARVSAF